METNVRTPMEIFNLPQHLVIPLFQRPYVWDEDDQWMPLWQDIRRMAELRLRDPYTSATHFLGAVVVQAQDSRLGHITGSNIIDGQQRLTTLQLFMDAASAVLEGHGLDALSGQIEGLTHNQDNFVQAGQTRLKLRHTNRDRAAFDEVMNADTPVDHQSLKHSGSRIARAHAFFSGAIAEWLGDSSDETFERRADALVLVMMRGLQLVVINLSASENSQEIFETLNARGTPLTAADLIKNFVFQSLDSEGVDTQRAYAEDWPFDTKFWEQEVSVGRYLVSRSSLFLNQWLVSRIGEEISPQSTFARFKTYVEHDSGQKISAMLPTIKAQAELYEAWTVAAGQPDRQLNTVEMAVYRMNANKIELLKPILLWLHSPERETSPETIDQVVRAVESWVIRRQLLRLTSSDLGRIVSDIIRNNLTVASDHLADRVSAQLSSLNVSSTYWPGDAEIIEALATETAFRRFQRPRLRMFLEAVENRYRSATNQPQVPRRNYPIEHVLPQKWDVNWNVEGLEAQQSRGAHVHRLGNLTLLTTSLNSKVSNGPWDVKREAFKEHDTLLLTSRLLKATEGGPWNEATIDERTTRLAQDLLEVWPVPPGHLGEVVDPQDKAQDWVEIKHLVIAGLLEPGTRLTPRTGKWAATEAVVNPDGLLEVDGQTYDSPSGAGRHVKGSHTNGWYFWRLEDGRKLADVRAEYQGKNPSSSATFDWGPLHTILEAIPEGRWASYGTIASVVGTAAQPLGNHVSSCAQCTNAHRILKSDGSIAFNFKWLDPEDERDPADMLRREGVSVVDGRADADYELTSEEVAELSPL